MRTSRLLFLFVITVLLMPACSLLAAPALTSTSVPTSTEVSPASPGASPSHSSLPTLTLTQTPTPTNTQVPLASAAELKARFDSEIDPLVKQLLSATENTAYALTPETQIIYVPQTERLFYVQSILNLTLTPAVGAKTAYVLYNYTRGSNLGVVINGREPLNPETRSVSAAIRLIVEENGKFTLVEKQEATGGIGSTSLRNLVERAVLPLGRLPSSNPAVKADLEKIIGYTCGIDMDPAVDYQRRAALLTFALSDADWAGRRQAADALGDLNPLPLEAVPALIPLLGDTGEGVSYAAETTLSKMAQVPQVFAQFRAAAGDPNAKIRSSVAKIIGKINTKPDAALETFLTLFHDKDAYVRKQAAEGLASLGGASVVPPMVAALKDQDPSIRQAAAEVLGKFGAQAASAVPDLMVLLQDTTPDVRQAAAHALAQIGGQQGNEGQNQPNPLPLDTAPTLIALLSDTAEGTPYCTGSKIVVPCRPLSEMVNTASEAETMLIKMGEDPQVFELLLKAAVDPNAEVRKRVATILCHIATRPEAALAPLLTLFYDKDDNVHQAAKTGLEVWAWDGKASVIPPMMDALKDKDPKIRQAAAEVLGIFKEQAVLAIPTLTALLQDATPDVRGAAAHALQWIGSESKSALPDLIRAARMETDEDAFRSEIFGIAELGSKAETLPLLKEALTRSQDGFRMAACVILGTYQGVPGAVEVLIPALSDKYQYVRRNAAQALAEFGSEAKTALPDLITVAQKEPEYTVFEDEILAIAAVGTKEDSLPVLKEALSRSQVGIRSRACNILGKYKGVPGAVDILILALDDKDEFVRSTVIQSLGSIGPEASPAAPALIKRIQAEKVDSKNVFFALDTLRRMGPAAKPVVPGLVEFLDSKNTRVKAAAITALQAITQQEFGGDAQKWKDWWEQNKDK